MSWGHILAAFLDYKVICLLWIAGSVALYALFAHLVHYARRFPDRPLGRLFLRWETWPHRFWPQQLLRFAYYLGLPYLALLQGVTSLRFLGLSHLDWISGIGSAASLGLGAFLLLAWGWSHYLRSLGRQRVERPRLAQARLLFQPWGWPLILLEVLYLEAHWAFYRAGPLVLLGNYWGVLAGLGITLLEWATDPRVRHSLGTEEQGDTLWYGSLALVTSIVFLFTRNLWLCLAVHLGLEMGLLAILGGIYRVQREPAA